MILSNYVKFSDVCEMYGLPVGTVAVASVAVGEVIFAGAVVVGSVVVGEVIFVGTVVVGSVVVGEVISDVDGVTSPENMTFKLFSVKNFPFFYLHILLCNKHQSVLPVVIETVTVTVEAVTLELAGVVVDVVPVDVVDVGPEVVKVVRGTFVGLTFGSS